MFNFKITFKITFLYLCSFVLASANCNFPTANFIKELEDSSSIKKISITIPKSGNYVKNQFKILRSNAKLILPKYKKNFKGKVKVIYEFGQCIYPARIRQNGDFKDHIYFQNEKIISSLDVKLKKGNIINSVRFKLLIPHTRNNLNEVLGTILLKHAGFIAPETFQVQTNVNGVESVMLFQEYVGKELIEKSKRREGPIFEGDESLLYGNNKFTNESLESVALSKIVNKKWFLKGDTSQEIFIEAYTKLQHAYLEFSQDMDARKEAFIRPDTKGQNLFDKYYLTMLALNGLHGLIPHNRKYYYNSFTQSFEPIYYDGDFKLTNDLQVDNTYISIIKNDQSNFIYKPVISNLPNIDKVFTDFKNSSLEEPYKENIFFNSALKKILENEKKIENIFNLSENNKYIKRNTYKDFKKFISNPNQKKIDHKTIIKFTKLNNNYEGITINNEKIILDDYDVAEILSRNNIEKYPYVFLPKNSNESQKKHFIEFKSTTLGHVRHSKTLLLDIDYLNKHLYIKQTKPDDWILFSNSNLNNWNIMFEGFINNNSILNLDSQRFNKYGLTGCLNFYKSTFNNTRLNVTDGLCEDSINIVNSHGNIKKTQIKNSFADGIDLDFSNLKFNKMIIFNSGNDCLDVSAGNYKVENLTTLFCGDKGVSVGEKSEMFIKNFETSNSSIGVSSKDSSKTFIQNAKIDNVGICYEAKQKKQEFDGSILSLKNSQCKGNNIIDKNSNLKRVNFEF